MPNDPYDPIEQMIRRQAEAQAGKKNKRVLDEGYKGLAEDIASSVWKLVSAPFRFPSKKDLGKMREDIRRQQDKYEQQNNPYWRPEGK
jgi:hypothetical protein